MFEKIGRLAEKTATNVNVSRRGFLGRLGNAALAAAGVLSFASSASGSSRHLVCCKWQTWGGTAYACFLHKCPSYADQARGMCGGYC